MHQSQLPFRIPIPHISFSLFPPCSQNDKLPGPFSAHKAHLSYREKREYNKGGGAGEKEAPVGSETSSPVDSALSSFIMLRSYVQLFTWINFFSYLVNNLDKARGRFKSRCDNECHCFGNHNQFVSLTPPCV